MKLFKILIPVIFLISTALFANNFNDVKLISANGNQQTYTITFKDFKINNQDLKNNGANTVISFQNAVYPQNQNPYQLPSRILNIALPKNGEITFTIISKNNTSLNNIILKKKPGNSFETDKGDIKRSLIELGPKIRFRDIYYRSLQINNVLYNPGLSELTFIESITISISFSGNYNTNSKFAISGKLDHLYKNLFLNFNQAKNWQIKKEPKLFKQSIINDDTYYGISVDEDGIYKVKSSLLGNSDININSLQLYNNGGHELSLATNASQFNPPFVQETAIMVFDLNENNLFDNDDYFLFYGKSLDGWYYDQNEKTFTHQKHSFATKNMYYLSINGSNGKRVQTSAFQQQTNLPVQDYFIDRFHYEKDIYNLLNSGPDWYGYKFFGKSDSYSLEFNLSDLSSNGPAAEIEIQMKGGSGVHYPTPSETFTYNFTLGLNNIALDLHYVFSNYYSKKIKTAFDNSILKETNKLTFNYSSNYETSTAHLDWVSILYSKETKAYNDYLNFYVDSDNTTNRNIQINGFGNINNLHLLDVTNPLDPTLLAENQSPNSGSFIFTFPSDLSSKNLISFGLNSPNIKIVSELKQYQPKNNLLDNTKSADFIIITRNSLLEYGNKIAEIRDSLKTEVVSIEDINFFFNNGVQDPVAIRNFIRYAYNNWQSPSVSYVLLFGDGHFDYRNIIISDSIIVPTFQIFAESEIEGSSIARESDVFYGQLETDDNNETQLLIMPSVAIGRLPVENALDAERVVEKLRLYKENPIKDGWQSTITFVADDQNSGAGVTSEWVHQRDADILTRQAGLKKFLKKKIYISAYESVPGGRKVIKPKATQEIIDQINRGTIILNYTGHGSPVQWAHETIFNFERDYPKINNENKFPFIIAATCDFGIFDNPDNLSFSEALIWKENSGAIAVLTPTRIVYSQLNDQFSNYYYRSLFPADGSPSRTLGDAFVAAFNLNTALSNVNDQKFHLLGDPSMHLADARNDLKIISVSSDTLKALSNIEVRAQVQIDNQIAANFNGGAVIIVNDALYDSINTGGELNYNLNGPLIFKGEVSVEDGILSSNFIVPKTIRYKLRKTGRMTFYAWNETTNQTAGGYLDTLLFYGSSSLSREEEGPQIDIYFEGHENFDSGDMIPVNSVLIASLNDKSGINMTGQLGHKIELQIDDNNIIDISESFVYDRDSYEGGLIHYPLPGLSLGEHTISLQAYDNLNNRSQSQVSFSIINDDGIILRDVVNYPNPFKKNTAFTFRTNFPGAEYSIKIYTLSGRLIEKLEGITNDNYNSIPWNGLDRDGNTLANGIYLYKIVLKNNGKTKEIIEKMAVLN